MKLYVFEGTAEEISTIVDTLQPSTVADITSVKVPEFVTVDCARRILTRRQLSGPLNAMLKVIYQAHPEWVSSADLHTATGYVSRQFSGFMGAFGRRKWNTAGFENERYAAFFERRRSGGDGPWEYRLPDSVREALRLESLVPAERENEEG